MCTSEKGESFMPPAARFTDSVLIGFLPAWCGLPVAAVVAGADIRACVTLLPVPPHGPGVVISGSSSVMIGNLPAVRQGDTIPEAAGPSSSITMGCTTVMIG